MFAGVVRFAWNLIASNKPIAGGMRNALSQCSPKLVNKQGFPTRLEVFGNPL